MLNDWLAGPPSAAQVAEHAKKYPSRYVPDAGRWLCRSAHGEPQVCLLNIAKEKVRQSGVDEWFTPADVEFQYLPIDSEGLPVDYGALQKVAEAAKRQSRSRVLHVSKDLRTALRELEEARR